MGCGPQRPFASCCKLLCSQHTGIPVTVGARRVPTRVPGCVPAHVPASVPARVPTRVPAVCTPVCPAVCPPMCLAVCPPVCPPMCPPVCPPMCPPLCPVPGPPHCLSACMRGPPSLSALTWVVGPPPGGHLPSPHPAPPQHPSEVAALGFGWEWPPRRPPLQWGPVGPGPRGRHRSAPERRPGSVSLLHRRSPEGRDPGRGLHKGVSQGGSALGPRHQELVGKATAAPVTPGAQG